MVQVADFVFQLRVRSCAHVRVCRLMVRCDDKKEGVLTYADVVCSGLFELVLKETDLLLQPSHHRLVVHHLKPPSISNHTNGRPKRVGKVKD